MRLWTKTPVWLKATFLNVVLMFPMIGLVQGLVINQNLRYYTSIPWAVPVALLLLGGFYFLTKRFTNFTEKEDVRIRLGFDFTQLRYWCYIVGIVFLLPSIMTLNAYLFDVQNTTIKSYISLFGALPPISAVPLLLVLAFSAGLTEEIVYRGYIQNILSRRYSRWLSFLIVAILFTVMHGLPPVLVLPYLLFSALFSYVADQVKSTGVVIFAHFLVDAVSFLLVYSNPELLNTPTMENILIASGILVMGVTAMLLPLKMKGAPELVYHTQQSVK